MAASPDWPWQSLAEAAAAVKAGAVSPVELARACLERIERVDRVVHAFVSVDAQGALQDAAKAEREIKAGHYRSPLHGIPIGLKDNYDTTGVATRNGSGVFADRMPTQDATTWRSEEHTSELQSRRDLVCRLLLEKKKKKQI